VFGNDKIKVALERLNKLVDSEERLVIAATYSSTQKAAQAVETTAQAVGRTELKVETSARTIEEIKINQQSQYLKLQIYLSYI
jgi:hypothetical protein